MSLLLKGHRPLYLSRFLGKHNKMSSFSSEPVKIIYDPGKPNTPYTNNYRESKECQKYQRRDSENVNTYSVTNNIDEKFMLPNKQSQSPR